MGIRFNVPGKERKKLAEAVAEWDGSEVTYCGAPTFMYRIGESLTVDRSGLLESNGLDDCAFESLTEYLWEHGFECDMSEETLEEANTALTEADTAEKRTGISIQLPMPDEAAVANLKALVEAKGGLIKQAIGADSLPIEEIDGRLDFPWFSADSSPEAIQTYMKFITKLCEMAKNAKRVTAKEKEATNPKYEFRCFLLRLGFIGDEYKADRKLLLKNLSGSSAFKSGSKGGEQ